RRHDHRPERAKPGQLLAPEPQEADVLEADRVEHATGGLGDPLGRMPARGSSVTVLVITPPSEGSGTTCAYSSPYPNVPEAVSTGLRSSIGPIRTERSTFGSRLLRDGALTRSAPSPGRASRRPDPRRNTWRSRGCRARKAAGSRMPRARARCAPGGSRGRPRCRTP